MTGHQRGDARKRQQDNSNPAPSGEQLYREHGWSGCAGSDWAELTPAAREGWEYAANAVAAEHRRCQHVADAQPDHVTGYVEAVHDAARIVRGEG